MKTKTTGLGRTTIKQSVLERIWLEAVRQQIRQEVVR